MIVIVDPLDAVTIVVFSVGVVLGAAVGDVVGGGAVDTEDEEEVGGVVEILVDDDDDDGGNGVVVKLLLGADEEVPGVVAAVEGRSVEALVGADAVVGDEDTESVGCGLPVLVLLDMTKV
jgi:hypothetical protein